MEGNNATYQLFKHDIANFVVLNINGKESSHILSPKYATAKKELKTIIKLFKKKGVELSEAPKPTRKSKLKSAS